jgi:hypothetical protein
VIPNFLMVGRQCIAFSVGNATHKTSLVNIL